MNDIEELQNKPSELEKLAAQKRLYSEAKKIFFYRTLFAILIAIFSPLLSLWQPALGNYLAAGACFYLVLDFFIFEKSESYKRSTAAKIQELFDTEVLSIKWNYIIAEKPDQEEIAKCLDKDGENNFDGLPNWYPEGVSQLPLDIATIVCQRANICWDSRLRRSYIYFLYGVLIVAGLFVLWFNKDKTVVEAMVFFASVIPFFKVFIEQIISHYNAAECLDTLKKQLEGILDKRLADKSSSIDEATIRSIQDEIYRHRKDVKSIPDFFYAMRRKKYEKLMKFGAQKYIENYLKQAKNN